MTRSTVSLLMSSHFAVVAPTKFSRQVSQRDAVSFSGRPVNSPKTFLAVVIAGFSLLLAAPSFAQSPAQKAKENIKNQLERQRMFSPQQVQRNIDSTAALIKKIPAECPQAPIKVQEKPDGTWLFTLGTNSVEYCPCGFGTVVFYKNGKEVKQPLTGDYWGGPYFTPQKASGIIIDFLKNGRLPEDSTPYLPNAVPSKKEPRA
ncbi:MAG: hypothetical protein QE263_08305 [Vampirovibrionales bacterium]|nr:hypothetical protein [Vampirovibrionales bacterium]